MNPTLVPYHLPLGTGIQTTSPLTLLLWLVEQLNEAVKQNPDDLRGKWKVIAYSQSIDELLDEEGGLKEIFGDEYRAKIDEGASMLSYFAGPGVAFGPKWDDLTSYVYIEHGD